MGLSYFSKYFQIKRHNIHDYDIRNMNKLVIDRFKLESTKRAFFIKGQIFLTTVFESTVILFISFHMYNFTFLLILHKFYSFNQLLNIYFTLNPC